MRVLFLCALRVLICRHILLPGPTADQVVDISAEADPESGSGTATSILEAVLSHHALDASLLIAHVLDPVAAFLSRSQQHHAEGGAAA